MEQGHNELYMYQYRVGHEIFILTEVEQLGITPCVIDRYRRQRLNDHREVLIKCFRAAIHRRESRPGKAVRIFHIPCWVRRVSHFRCIGPGSCILGQVSTNPAGVRVCTGARFLSGRRRLDLAGNRASCCLDIIIDASRLRNPNQEIINLDFGLWIMVRITSLHNDYKAIPYYTKTFHFSSQNNFRLA